MTDTLRYSIQYRRAGTRERWRTAKSYPADREDYAVVARTIEHPRFEFQLLEMPFNWLAATA